MKIAFIIPNFLPFGGNSRTVMTYIENMQEFAEKIVLVESYGITRSDDDSVKKLLSIKNLSIVQSRVKWYKIVDFTRSIRHGELFHYMFYPFMSILKRLLNGRIRREFKDFDAIYLFDFTDAAIFPRSCKNTILGTHNQRMSKGKALLINKGIFLPSISAFRLFQNESAYAKIITAKKGFIIPKGTDTNLFYPRETEHGGKIRFLYVARLEPKKGFELLLSVWRKMDLRGDCELHIAGSGSLSSLINEIKCNNLVYHGEMRRSDLADLYSQSDYFVFPTEWDAQPSVVVEAVSSGLICLISDAMKGSLDDLEGQGYVKYIKNEIEDFAASMVNAINSGPVSLDLKKRMHEYIEDHRSLKIEIEGLKEAFSYLSTKRYY